MGNTHASDVEGRMSRVNTGRRINCLREVPRWFDAGHAGGLIDTKALGVQLIYFYSFIAQLPHDFRFSHSWAIPLTGYRNTEQGFLGTILTPLFRKIRKINE